MLDVLDVHLTRPRSDENAFTKAFSSLLIDFDFMGYFAFILDIGSST